jgi:lipoprotein-releasing system permease protein
MKTSLSTFVAFRYFFSKKSQRVINIISIISAVGVTIGTAALIIVLSVFNGFEDLILRLYNSFDPDLKIELKEGKTFEINANDIASLKKINGIKFVSEVIDESALARYHDRQLIIRLKGVSEDFSRMTGLDTMIVQGEFKLQNGDSDFAVVGSAVAYNLGIDPSNIYNQFEIFAPKKSASAADPEGAFNRRFISPAGIFSVQQDFDTKYIIVPLRFASEIFEYENRLTALEIKLNDNGDENEVSKNIKSQLGDKFEVKNRFMMHETLYKIMRSEKWAVFLILTFILIIAIFNVISSLTMLVIEKKKDIVIYRSIGADVVFLRKIFLKEGMMITFIGAVAGIFLGFIVCIIQQKFGLIQLSGSGTFIIDAYPVKMSPKDFVYVLLTVCFIGFIAAWYPARKLIKEEIDLKEVAEQ